MARPIIEHSRRRTRMLKPLGDRVVIRPKEQEEVTRGGILLPDSARKRPFEGEVIAVGSGRVMRDGTRAPLSVKVGDVVMYARYAGTEVRVDDEDLIILDEDSVMAIKE
jgi:chaperonin GroES